MIPFYLNKSRGVSMDHVFHKRYVVRFVAICLGLFIVTSFLPIPGSFNLLVAAGISFYVGRLFAKDHKRVPEISEQNRYAAFSFVALVLITAALTAFLVMGLPPEEKEVFLAPFREKSLSVMIVGTLLAFLMLWGCIHFSFGLGARLYMKKQSEPISKDAE